jgi:hypothetical protein
MDNIYRDVNRLLLILEDVKGQESFSLKTRLSDFISYFFKRFLVNIKSTTKLFAASELEMFINRHSNKVNVVLNDPLISLKDVLIPIPKGMIHSYKETLNVLLEVSNKINSEMIGSDLKTIIANIQNNNSSEMLHDPRTSLKIYEDCKKTIGALYSNKGLLNVPGNLAFLSIEDISTSKDMILQIAKQYYTEVIEIHALIDKIDKLHSGEMISEVSLSNTQESVMDLAYRVSIFAVVMNHIQELEHAFVKALNVLITHR